MNMFTGGVIWILVMMSVILTASVLFPEATTSEMIVRILVGGGVIGFVGAVAVLMPRHGERTRARVRARTNARFVGISRDLWRMPPLETLEPAKLSRSSRLWMLVLRGYLVLAGGLVLARIVMLAAK